MEPIKDTINLKITNNTNLPQQVSILGGNQDPNGTPANFLYQWNIATESFFATDYVVIQAAPSSNPSAITNYEAPLQNGNIDGVVSALNSMGIGQFQYSGNTIYASTNNWVYGQLYIEARNAFISVWDTTLTSIGSSASNQINLPVYSTGTYNFQVDWGDGTTDTITAWNQPEVLHTYVSPGTYTVKIIGVFTKIGFSGASQDNLKLLSILSWGKVNLGNVIGAFTGCTNLDLSQVSNVLDLTGVSTLNGLFSSCTNITTIGRINDWDVSAITDFTNMFIDTSFNDYIGSWQISNTGSVSMSAMFVNTPFNQDIGQWNTIGVINMGTMFAGATAFNQDISGWNVSNVFTMEQMFDGATSFNQPIGVWNVSSVQYMFKMFQGAMAFNQDISAWNISSVVDFTDFMLGKTNLDYSAANLNAIYNTWSTLIVNPSLTINFGTIKYTLAGQAGRNVLTGTYLWTIFDGGI